MSKRLANSVNPDQSDLSHILRKSVFAICEQQRHKSACASMQTDKCLCYSLPNASSFYIWNFKPLASFCGCTGQFESYLVTNPEDRFSLDEAHDLSVWNLQISLQQLTCFPHACELVTALSPMSISTKRKTTAVMDRDTLTSWKVLCHSDTWKMLYHKNPKNSDTPNNCSN